jgi:hypothetical protein
VRSQIRTLLTAPPEPTLSITRIELLALADGFCGLVPLGPSEPISAADTGVCVNASYQVPIGTVFDEES